MEEQINNSKSTVNKNLFEQIKVSFKLSQDESLLYLF